jgi:drug/metabolite transporter (DMT)-like permease
MTRMSEEVKHEPGPLARLRTGLASPHLIRSLAVLCWAGNFTVGRAARDVIPPLALNFWRWSLALAILAPFALPAVLRHRDLIRREWKLLTGLAVSGITFFHSAIYIGLSLSPVINGLLLQATIPLFIVLLSWLIHRTPVTAPQAVGLALSLAGAIAVITEGDLGNLVALRIATGDLWLAASVPSWALYSVLLRQRPEALPPLALIWIVAAFAMVLLLPFYGLELASGARIELGPASLLSLGYVALFASVIAYIFWNQGVREIGPNRAGIYIQLMPVYGAALAMTFLGERMAGHHWLGAALVLAGLLVAQRGR